MQVFVPWATEHIQIAKPTAPGVLILIVFYIEEGTQDDFGMKRNQGTW